MCLRMIEIEICKGWIYTQLCLPIVLLDRYIRNYACEVEKTQRGFFGYHGFPSPFVRAHLANTYTLIEQSHNIHHTKSI